MFLKKLMSITEMSEQWVVARIKQKGDSKCTPWKNLRDLILAHPNMKKRVDVFTLSIYDLVIFLKALGHVDEVILDLFDRLDKRVMPVLTILAETFKSLNACRRTGRNGLLSSFLRELLSFERTSGYTKARRHFRRKMDGDSLESPRRGCRMESPLDDPR
ncbi:hypothetical protein Gohar_021792 [Gossypium harknessii]|uniref:Uncharacterized protein n=1 Tax=Gossypium harknessii TaxID=34285 RepID=A0A7J9ID89_9ROSI|nr:hypothetical protein [Gossypium harknessii]